MHRHAGAQPDPPSVFAAEEQLVQRSDARLLITASTSEAVEDLARRIHGASSRAECHFVRMRAADLALEPRTLAAACSDLLDAAAGGTVLILDVEELPPTVQDLLIDLLADVESARAPAARARIVCGTTVSLLDRVRAGVFSEQLFYRLNIIHLITVPVAGAAEHA